MMDIKSPEATASLASNASLVLIFTTVTLAVYFIINRRQGYERWGKYGVKHVDIPIEQFFAIRNQRLMNKYGPTVGIMRDVPILVTRDLDILKQVMVKDFNNFVNRNDNMPTRSLLGKGVFFLKDYDWKRIRKLMSPSFSTGKLKRISTHVQEAATRLSEAFENCARNGSPLKLFHTTGQYSTSIIAKTAFGVQADSIGQEEDDQFTHCVKNIFKKRTKTGLFFIFVLMHFRALRNLLVTTLGVYFPDPCTKMSNDYFNAVLKESISEREMAERRGSQIQHNDFLQSLVSTKIASEDATVTRSKSEKISHSNGSAQAGEAEAPVSPKNTITRDEVIAQSLITILAAYETTASTLQFCLFKLAQNPHIQERVFQEIIEVVEHQNPTHEELSKLHYMEQVVNETLRLFPPLTRISREAYETRTYGSITIPAGAAIEIPIKEIHLDPANYPDPHVFDPERFNEDNKSKLNPLAFIPFGQGPRLCIGMRLAYLEMKTALVQVLRKVKVELNESTVPRAGEDLMMNYRFFPRPEKPIELAVTLRDDQL